MRSLILRERREAEEIQILFKTEAETRRPFMPGSVAMDPSTMEYLASQLCDAVRQPFATLHFKVSRSLAVLLATRSDRQGRAMGKGQSASMEDKRQEGHF